MSDNKRISDKYISPSLVVLLVFMLVFPVLTTNVRAGDVERSVTIPAGEHVSEHVTLEDGFVGIETEIINGSVYNVFVYSEDEYERYLEEGSATVSGFLVERRIRELSESERISQNVYVVFENPEPDEEIRIRYRVYWAEDSDVLRRGVMFCGLGVFAIILVLVFFFKYKNWAKRKVYGWFGADDEITDGKTNIGSGDEPSEDKNEEEIQRLKKRLEELEGKKDEKEEKV